MFKYFEINEDGHNIRCKVYAEDLKKARRAVIFGIGFAGHKDNKAAQRFAEKAYGKYKDLITVVFNWPCHGDDVKKKLYLSDCERYLDLVLDKVKERFGVTELYANATSFGGYLFLKYISEKGNPFRRIALRCPAVNMYDTLAGSIIRGADYEKLQKGKEIQVGFDRKVPVTMGFLEELKENDIRTREFLDYAEDILIIHGTGDEVVPFAEGQQFADNNLIEFIPMEGADHRFQNPVKMDLANKYILEFFDL